MTTKDQASPTFTVVVPREAAGTRLDRFLAVELGQRAEGLSRSTLQRWIEHHRVRVGSRVMRAKDRVVAGSEITVSAEDAPAATAAPEEGIHFRVLYQDDALLVIDKPPGLVVHPARGHESGTLVNGLLALGVFARDVTADSLTAGTHARPGIVHRLDRGTSGIMVVARTAAAREHLKAQFAAHTIERAYEAIVVGKRGATVFRTLHGRHPKDRLRFTSHVKTGKQAVTHVTVIAELAGGLATHVICRLETGRTHQIRVHLAEGGTPVLGDALYGRKPKDPRLQVLAEELGHQALHARVLGFVHPTSGKQVRFESAPPEDFAKVLAALPR